MERNEKYKVDLDMPVRLVYFDKNVQMRVIGICRSLGIETLRDLVKSSQDIFIRSRTCGKLTTAAINNTLAEMGLKLGMRKEEVDMYESAYATKMNDPLRKLHFSIFHTIFKYQLETAKPSVSMDVIFSNTVSFAEMYEKVYMDYLVKRGSSNMQNDD